MVTRRRYIVEMRLHRARNLIVQTEQSITQIAMACGFNNHGISFQTKMKSDAVSSFALTPVRVIRSDPA